MQQEEMASGNVRLRIFEVTTVPSTIRVFLANRINYLSRHGFDMHVICAEMENRSQLPDDLKATVHHIPFTRSITPLADIVCILHMVKLFRRYRPAIVHTHTPKAGLLGMVAAWLASVPIRFHTVHGMVHLSRSGFHRTILRFFEKIPCQLAHRVLCVSHSLRTYMATDGLCPAHKTAVLGYGSACGVDTKRFSRTPEVERAAADIRVALGVGPDELLVGAIGRLTREKGIGDLVEAWKTIETQFPTAHLLLVGEFEKYDPLPQDVMNYIRDCPHIHTLDWQDNIVPYIATLDVLVQPSYREGFGMILIEAAALEVPTIASRILGCVNAIEEGKTGLLVEKENPQELVRACNQLLSNEHLRKQMGRTGRKRVEKHFVPIVIQENLLKEYTQHLKARNLPAPPFCQES